MMLPLRLGRMPVGGSKVCFADHRSNSEAVVIWSMIQQIRQNLRVLEVEQDSGDS